MSNQFTLKKPFTVLLKAHGALLLGMVSSLVFFQEESWLKIRFQHFIEQSMEQVIRVPFSCKVSHIDLFNGIIHVADIEAQHQAGAWSFKAPETEVHFSWLSWLKHANFDATLTFHRASLFSRHEQKIWAIVDPFLKIIQAPITFPIKIIGCIFQQSLIELERDKFHLSALVSSSSDIFTDVVSTRVVVGEGDLHHAQVGWARDLAGNVSIQVPVVNADNYQMKLQLMADLPFVERGSQKALLMYTYKDYVGSWQCYPEDRSFQISADSLLFTQDGIAGNANITGPLEKIGRYLPFMPILKGMEGAFTGKGTFLMTDESLEYEGIGSIGGCKWNGVRLGTCTAKAAGDRQQVQGSFEFSDIYGIATKSSWIYDLTSGLWKGTWTLAEPSLVLQLVTLQKEGTGATMTYNNGILTGFYTIKGIMKGTAAHTGRPLAIKGTGEGDDHKIQLKGTIEQIPFLIEIARDPLEVTRFTYNLKQKAGIDLVKKKEYLQGSIDFDYIKKACACLFSFKPQGTAKVSVMIDMKSHPVTLQLVWDKANIKIPEMQNFIKNGHTSFSYDKEKRCLMVKNADIGLQKGSLKSQCATFFFSDQGILLSAHVPCIANEAYVGWDKDFSAMVSGALVGLYTRDKKEGHWLCKGALTLDKGSLRKSLLSLRGSQQMTGSSLPIAKNIGLDLQITTKSPLVIKTFFFNMNAQINAFIKGTAAQPQLTGSADINKGAFFFPINLSS